MKFSVSTYSFGSELTRELGDIGLIGLAKDMDFEGVEFANIHVPEGAYALEYAATLRAECEKLKITPVNYTIGADFINGSDGNFEAEIERLRGEVDVAAALGVSGMRHDATKGFVTDRKWRGFDDALPIIAEGCRRVSEYAAGKGIRTMVEIGRASCRERV